MVSLSYGITYSPDGFAINDFESLPDGAITNLNIGVWRNGDCAWGETTVITRQ